MVLLQSSPSTRGPIALVALLTWALALVTCNAQEVQDRTTNSFEVEDEELAELLHEQREVKQELVFLARQSQLLKSRQTLLSDLARLHRLLLELEAVAESTADKATLERTEEKLEKTEQQLDATHSQLELNRRLGQSREFLEFALEEELGTGFANMAKAFHGNIQKAIELQEQVRVAIQEEKWNAANRLRRNARQLKSTWELQGEWLELQGVLFDAREEGDLEHAEEIEAELKNLERTLKRRQSGTIEKEQSTPKVQLNSSLLKPIPADQQSLAAFAYSDFESQVVAHLKENCFECHSSSSESGELNLELLIQERPIVKNRSKWINVLEQTKNRVMPPEDALEMQESSRSELVLALHKAIYEFDYSEINDPGYEPTRRLTHDEYDHTVRDLLGVEGRFARDFPSDLVGSSGFENSANTLFLQPVLMERYFGSAEAVAGQAFSPAHAGRRFGQAAFLRTFGSKRVDQLDEEDAIRAAQRFQAFAFRRPLSDEEKQKVRSRVIEAFSNGANSQQALQSQVLMTLVSPNFLLRGETTLNPSDAFRISDWELASRLSYFLWASMPDEELFTLARRGSLSTPSVLAAQVKRMLVDSRSKTLGSLFAAQWLGSRQVGTRIRLDPIDNPWCTESLMTAMRDETALFVHSLIRENKPIQHLVDSNYTYLNQELATLYGLKGIEGDEMRRVDISQKGRGGIFGHASLLAATSFPGRTSPVVRGKWILSDILGTPPPPPPPNVSQLSEKIEENDRLNFREKLELHRRSPNCYACHSQMDPLGFSLENYDWFGRYRGRRRGGRDVTGVLPNGTEFEGLGGLKRVILEERKDDLVRQISQKMLAYALGRQLEYFDEPAVREIIKQAEENELRFQSIIQAIVMSKPFQWKKARTQ